MTKPISFIYIALVFLLFVSCKNKQDDLFIDYLNNNIEYSGRIDTSKTNAAELYWSGSSIKINFKGNKILALLKDETGENYFNVIVDNKDVSIIRLDTAKRYFKLATGLSKGKHSIEIFKRTEWARGKTSFFGFKIKGNAEILPKDPPKKRKIEFYGNSITAAYAVEDYSGKDSPDSIYTNNYLSYAAFTARHFNAQYSCICRSGIGIMVSWYPQIMPEMYNRLNPNDSTSKWDFSRYSPDIVVINLFQNDSWIIKMRNSNEYKYRFRNSLVEEEFIVESYKEFVKTLRRHYSESEIICVLGNMDITRKASPWPGYVKRAVEELKDSNVHTLIIPYKKTPGHPNIEEQEKMANSLIKFIEENIEW